MKAFRIFILIILIIGLTGNISFSKNKKKKDLPPGLQKKVERGRELPPGWQKKLKKGETLEKGVYEQGVVIKPVNNKGIVTIKVDDRVIRLYKATREIVDILN